MDIAFCETIETKNVDVEFVNVFFCERIMVFKRWLDLDTDNFNDVWITIQTFKLPRNVINITIAGVYHPPL